MLTIQRPADTETRRTFGAATTYNKDLHGFAKEDLYVYSSHENILYFHPDFGVVVIGRHASLIRSDFDEKTK